MTSRTWHTPPAARSSAPLPPSPPPAGSLQQRPPPAGGVPTSRDPGSTFGVRGLHQIVFARIGGDL